MTSQTRIRDVLLILNMIVLLLITISFIWYIAYVYAFLNDWNYRIESIGTSLAKRILMSIHMVGGVLLMLLSPIQFLLSRFKKTMIVHRWMGRIIVIVSCIVALCGFIYIAAYGTVGKLPMSFAFAINGIFLFGMAILTMYLAIRMKKYRQINFMDDISVEDQKNKGYHQLSAYILFSIIYSSIFYRILYGISTLFGYPTPLADHPEMYQRFLDILFDYAFFIIPPLIAFLAFKISQLKEIFQSIALSFSLLILIFFLILLFINP